MAFDGCLAGLGNPGPGYAGNRHNLGFMVVDALARKCRHPRPPKESSQSDADLLDIVAPGGARILALKPTTFMNLSGFAVSRVLRYYKIPVENLLVVHDELDLPLGRMRFKRGGGDAGHNGVSSVIEQLGHGDFHRLRLGVGRPPAGYDVAGYVLSDFPEKDREVVEKVVEAATGAVLDFYRLGPAKAASRLGSFDAAPKGDVDNSGA
jgi:peptidyl-tRNA hydrolase, PTH1 family